LPAIYELGCGSGINQVMAGLFELEASGYYHASATTSRTASIPAYD
jgi:hypothetical protein